MHRLVYMSTRCDGFIVDRTSGEGVITGKASTYGRIKDIPADAGSRRPEMSIEWWQRYVTREFRTLGVFWQVFVIDDGGRPVFRGVRSGPGGTGKRWFWSPVPTWEFAFSQDGGHTFQQGATGLTQEDVDEHRERIVGDHPGAGRLAGPGYYKLTAGRRVWRWRYED